jgi:hypothetical protein
MLFTALVARLKTLSSQAVDAGTSLNSLASLASLTSSFKGTDSSFLDKVPLVLGTLEVFLETLPALLN